MTNDTFGNLARHYAKYNGMPGRERELELVQTVGGEDVVLDPRDTPADVGLSLVQSASLLVRRRRAPPTPDDSPPASPPGMRRRVSSAVPPGSADAGSEEDGTPIGCTQQYL